MIKGTFLFYKTFNKFKEDLASGIIDDKHIAFIKDIKAIWTHGVLFAGDSNNDYLDNYVTKNQLANAIANCTEGINQTLLENYYKKESLYTKQEVNNIESELYQTIQQIKDRAEGCLGFFENSNQLPQETKVGNWAIVPSTDGWFIWSYTNNGWESTDVEYEHPQINLNGYATTEELNRQLNIVIQGYTDAIESLGISNYATKAWVRTTLDENYYQKSDLYTKRQIDEKLRLINTNTSSGGGNSCDCPKHIILEEGQYDENNYEEGAIYFILGPETQTQWGFGGTFPIILSGGWTFGGEFPITLT